MRLSGPWAQALKGYKRLVGTWAQAALKGRKGEVSIVLADDARLQQLNRDYRGKNKPTNVLSFSGSGDCLGDVILAFETVRHEALEQHKRFAHHTAHLVVHGCLHLLGHDHENEREAAEMERQEKRILARLGIPDPYESLYE